MLPLDTLRRDWKIVVRNPLKFGACLPSFSACPDRFCLDGYGGGAKSLEEMLGLASQVSGLRGIELVSQWHVREENIAAVRGQVEGAGLEICMLTADLWTQARWGSGSFTSRDAGLRSLAVNEVKKVMDWAAQLGCPRVCIWPGQDGYDYLFQADYRRQWEWLVQGLIECADHRRDVTLALEFKPREPRTHIVLSSVGRAILLVDEIGRSNVGVLLDTGHAMQGGENPAECVALLSRRRCLAYMHFNDNWGGWDDDMMVGSLHWPALIETIYWLRKAGYDGWYTLDIFPYRENRLEAVRESIAWIQSVADFIDYHGLEVFDRLIEAGDAAATSRFLRNALFGLPRASS